MIHRFGTAARCAASGQARESRAWARRGVKKRAASGGGVTAPYASRFDHYGEPSLAQESVFRNARLE
jgi:hypothetical protein